MIDIYNHSVFQQTPPNHEEKKYVNLKFSSKNRNSKDSRVPHKLFKDDQKDARVHKLFKVGQQSKSSIQNDMPLVQIKNVRKQRVQEVNLIKNRINYLEAKENIAKWNLKQSSILAQ